jgi:hypothetical protein
LIETFPKKSWYGMEISNIFNNIFCIWIFPFFLPVQIEVAANAHQLTFKVGI